jgi:predicted PurR-regulated permease PerM
LNIFPRRYLELVDRLRATEIINGTVRGYLIVIILQLIVGIGGFLLFNIPAAFLLGSFYGFSSLLTRCRRFSGLGACCLVAIGARQHFIGSFLASWFIGLSFLIENVLAPKIIGQSTKLHQLIVMFSVFGGIQYFGLIGMVLGPVVIALAFIAFEIIKELSHHEFDRQNETT